MVMCYKFDNVCSPSPPAQQAGIAKNQVRVPTICIKWLIKSSNYPKLNTTIKPNVGEK